MREFLIFRLYGMMASWGDIAVGELRPTFDHPSRSAIVGLLAAALGIRRDEEEQLSALSNACRIAIRVDAPGVLLRDYHTSQVPPAGRGRKKRSFATRKEELAIPREDLSTVLSTRDYRCDAVSTVCVESAPCSLADLANALNNPVFVRISGGSPARPLSRFMRRLFAARTLRPRSRRRGSPTATFCRGCSAMATCGSSGREMKMQGSRRSRRPCVTTIR